METELASLPVEAEGAADADAFEERLWPLLKPAFTLAQAMLRDRLEAEDAGRLARAPQFSDRGRGMRPWFLTIVANRCRSRLRSRWWHVWRRPDVELPGSDQFEGRAVFRADLARALDRLSWGQRATLFLAYELDLPHEEVGRILGIGVGTVKSRVHRAVLRLREAMAEEDSDENA
jgi:RNA polymerase sigma-70 factor (ECF subfamily)